MERGGFNGLHKMVSEALSELTKICDETAASMSIRTNFPIPYYMLDAPVGGLDGLVEFTAEEYLAMGGRVFEGERNYNARQIDFCGQRWEVQLQTVEGCLQDRATRYLSHWARGQILRDADARLLQRKVRAAEHSAPSGAVHLGRD
jgi:hypothetical protein